MEITSLRNPLLQKVRKAAASGRQTEDGLIVAEGPHLLEEALRGIWRVSQVITTSAGRRKYADLLQFAHANVVEVPTRVFESLTETEHSQQVLALLDRRLWDWPDLMGSRPLLIALDGLQDPGNAGTIIRSAEAFGATGVVLLKGSAHIANGKLLRASAGSIFRIPVMDAVDRSEFLAKTHENGLALYALDARAGPSIASVDLVGPLAILAGNEGSGISPELFSAAQPVSIPATNVESINVAAACSIALFVAQQQRNSP